MVERRKPDGEEHAPPTPRATTQGRAGGKRREKLSTCAKMAQVESPTHTVTLPTTHLELHRGMIVAQPRTVRA